MFRNSRNIFHRAAWLATAVPLVCFAAAGVAIAEPTTERTIVTATADASQDRILIRWQQVEGIDRRFTHYDVLRREASATTLTKLNIQPIGPLTTVAAIEALFDEAANAAALATILDSLGPDYASDLLAMQAADASGVEQFQQRIAPDMNYAVALALGLGWMDDTVTAS